MAKPQQSNKKSAIQPTRSADFPEWYQQVIRAAGQSFTITRTAAGPIHTDGEVHHSVIQNNSRIFHLTNNLLD